jgi:hypothetical protein
MACRTPGPTGKSTHSTYEELTGNGWFFYYRQNMLDSAEILLKNHLEAHPRKRPTLIYYAELLRRKEEYRQADRIADTILALDSCTGAAWMINGDIRNRQYGCNSVQLDSPGYHHYYAEGVRRDSTKGNLWMSALFLF